MLGLFAFFYGSLHAATYVVLDQFFDLGVDPRRHREAAVHYRRVHRVRADGAAGDHVDGRVDPAAGRSALAALAPAGLRLRRALASIHYYWLVKADVTRPLRYAAVLAVLLMARAVWWR